MHIPLFFFNTWKWQSTHFHTYTQTHVNTHVTYTCMSASYNLVCEEDKQHLRRGQTNVFIRGGRWTSSYFYLVSHTMVRSQVSSDKGRITPSLLVQGAGQSTPHSEVCRVS